MKTKRNIKTVLILFCVLFVSMSVYLVYTVSVYGTRYFTSPYNTRTEKISNRVEAGKILDRNEKTLAYTSDGEREYSDSKTTRLATAHVLGDDMGQTIGAQSMFARYLLGFDQSVLDMILHPDSTLKGSNVELTIDSKLCRDIYELMEDHKGAVVITNYKTGEILASVSTPSFDPKKIKDYLDGDYELEDGALVNRATMGVYTPGSTFKIVTIVAALRYLPNVTEREFDCTGPLVFDKDTGKFRNGLTYSELTDDEKLDYVYLTDYKNETHGTMTLKEAFASSCNVTFARLAMEIGSSRLMKVAEELGVNKEFLFEEIMVNAGKMETGNSDYRLAWAGVGQHKDVMTPLHMCLLTGAVANNGTMMEPKLLNSVKTASGTQKHSLKAETYKQAIKPYEAEIIKEYMIEAVKHGTGTEAKISGVTVGGKTGSAEVSSNKETGTHAWFTGFIDSNKYPFAICVVCERAGTGGSVAAPIAKKALEMAMERLA
ncbi:MAG: hypothetical protein IJF80_06865 [Clostridia bacterium]|nr:hypothetical protein [Clostridia bacterium]